MLEVHFHEWLFVVIFFVCLSFWLHGCWVECTAGILFTRCCFAVQLCETTSCVGFHNHQGTGAGFSEVYHFPIKLECLWPVCPSDLWLDGVNTNLTVGLGYISVCVLGHAFLCYFRWTDIFQEEKGEIAHSLFVIVKQASLIVCLCVFFLIFFLKDILPAWSFH